MNILGISAFYHDSAACLVIDGEIAAAAQEERFSRKKHDSGFPLQTIEWCLKECSLGVEDIDYVVFYDKPFLKYERILETSFASAPFGLRQFIQAMPLWIKERIWVTELIRQKLSYNGKVLFTEHHESHAASAFYPSPFEEAAFLTIDGVGEWETTTLGVGNVNGIKILEYLRFPHSLGLLYSAFTYYAGFKVNSGEYKLMGLAPYGEPKYEKIILNELIDLKQDGSFKLSMKHFAYCNGLKMTNHRFNKLFGGPARIPETEIRRKDMDMAASIQKVTGEIMLRMARHLHKLCGKDKLCLAGGVALNCVGSSRILKEGPFKDVWIQPASGDAGGALGAALLVWHKYLGKTRKADNKNDRQKGSFLGPSFKDEDIEDFLKKDNIIYQKIDYADMPNIISQLIIDGKAIGWFQGKLEFGPRALGARSIIGDPRNPQMQSKMNLKIKFRESFRPFAPAVLREEAGEWFELDKESPYMLLVAAVKNEKRIPVDPKLSGLDKLKVARSSIPAVTHVDYSARIQTVKKEDNRLFYELIAEFNRKTGCPLLINTSFNVRGEPLVCSPQEAFSCFINTEMDYLVMGSFLIDKSKQEKGSQKRELCRSLELD